MISGQLISTVFCRLTGCQQDPRDRGVTHSLLAGQVRDAHVTSFGVRFEPRFFLCARFSIIHFLDLSFYLIFLGKNIY